MALRLLVELLCVGVSQNVAGVLGVLQGLVRAPATPHGILEGSLAASGRPLVCCIAAHVSRAVRGVHFHRTVLFVTKQPPLTLGTKH